MKNIFIALMILTSVFAFAGEVTCKTLSTSQDADKVTQEYINSSCDASKPFSISDSSVEAGGVFATYIYSTRVCCSRKP